MSGKTYLGYLIPDTLSVGKDVPRVPCSRHSKCRECRTSGTLFQTLLSVGIDVPRVLYSWHSKCWEWRTLGTNTIYLLPRVLRTLKSTHQSVVWCHDLIFSHMFNLWIYDRLNFTDAYSMSTQYPWQHINSIFFYRKTKKNLKKRKTKKSLKFFSEDFLVFVFSRFVFVFSEIENYDLSAATGTAYS